MRSNGEEAETIIALFLLYEKKMYHIAYAILHDSYQAEDAVMNAFVKMLSKQYKVEDPESDAAKSLVIQVTRSAAIDLYRMNQREQEHSQLTEDPLILSRGKTEDPPDLQTGGAGELIASLPIKYREVLYYRFVQEYSAAETAGLLGISPEAVRKRQERAIKLLRKKAHSGGVFSEKYCGNA